MQHAGENYEMHISFNSNIQNQWQIAYLSSQRFVSSQAT